MYMCVRDIQSVVAGITVERNGNPFEVTRIRRLGVDLERTAEELEMHQRLHSL